MDPAGEAVSEPEDGEIVDENEVDSGQEFGEYEEIVQSHPPRKKHKGYSSFKSSRRFVPRPKVKRLKPRENSHPSYFQRRSHYESHGHKGPTTRSRAGSRRQSHQVSHSDSYSIQDVSDQSPVWNEEETERGSKCVDEERDIIIQQTIEAAAKLPLVCVNGAYLPDGAEIQRLVTTAVETEPVSDDEESIVEVLTNGKPESPLIITLDTTDTSDEEGEGGKSKKEKKGQVEVAAIYETTTNAEEVKLDGILGAQTGSEQADEVVDLPDPEIPDEIENTDGADGGNGEGGNSEQVEIPSGCTSDAEDDDIYVLELRNKLLAELVEKTDRAEEARAAKSDEISREEIEIDNFDDTLDEEIALREVLLSQLTNRKRQLEENAAREGKSFDESGGGSDDGRGTESQKVYLSTKGICDSITGEMDGQNESGRKWISSFSAVEEGLRSEPQVSCAPSTSSHQSEAFTHYRQVTVAGRQGNSPGTPKGTPRGRGRKGKMKQKGKNRSGGNQFHQQEISPLIGTDLHYRTVTFGSDPSISPNSSSGRQSTRKLPQNDLRNILLRNRKVEQTVLPQENHLTALFPQFGVADTDMRQESVGSLLDDSPDITIMRTVNFNSNQATTTASNLNLHGSVRQEGLGDFPPNASFLPVQVRPPVLAPVDFNYLNQPRMPGFVGPPAAFLPLNPLRIDIGQEAENRSLGFGMNPYSPHAAPVPVERSVQEFPQVHPISSPSVGKPKILSLFDIKLKNDPSVKPIPTLQTSPDSGSSRKSGGNNRSANIVIVPSPRVSPNSTKTKSDQSKDATVKQETLPTNLSEPSKDKPTSAKPGKAPENKVKNSAVVVTPQKALAVSKEPKVTKTTEGSSEPEIKSLPIQDGSSSKTANTSSAATTEGKPSATGQDSKQTTTSSKPTKLPQNKVEPKKLIKDSVRASKRNVVNLTEEVLVSEIVKSSTSTEGKINEVSEKNTQPITAAPSVTITTKETRANKSTLAKKVTASSPLGASPLNLQSTVIKDGVAKLAPTEKQNKTDVKVTKLKDQCSLVDSSDVICLTPKPDKVVKASEPSVKKTTTAKIRKLPSADIVSEAVTVNNSLPETLSSQTGTKQISKLPQTTCTASNSKPSPTQLTTSDISSATPSIPSQTKKPVPASIPITDPTPKKLVPSSIANSATQGPAPNVINTKTSVSTPVPAPIENDTVTPTLERVPSSITEPPCENIPVTRSSTNVETDDRPNSPIKNPAASTSPISLASPTAAVKSSTTCCVSPTSNGAGVGPTLASSPGLSNVSTSTTSATDESNASQVNTEDSSCNSTTITSATPETDLPTSTVESTSAANAVPSELPDSQTITSSQLNSRPEALKDSVLKTAAEIPTNSSSVSQRFKPQRTSPPKSSSSAGLAGSSSSSPVPIVSKADSLTSSIIDNIREVSTSLNLASAASSVSPTNKSNAVPVSKPAPKLTKPTSFQSKLKGQSPEPTSVRSSSPSASSSSKRIPPSKLTVNKTMTLTSLDSTNNPLNLLVAAATSAVSGITSEQSSSKLVSSSPNTSSSANATSSKGDPSTSGSEDGGFVENLKAMIKNLSERVMDTRRQVTLSFKEKELIQCRQKCYSEYRKILKDLQQHSRLIAVEVKMGEDITDLEKKLEVLKKRRESIQLKAVDLNGSIRQNARAALTQKKLCQTLSAEVKRLGDKVIGGGRYRVPDTLVENVNEIVLSLRNLDNKQSLSLQRERGVTFKQLVLEEGAFVNPAVNPLRSDPIVTINSQALSKVFPSILSTEQRVEQPKKRKTVPTPAIEGPSPKKTAAASVRGKQPISNPAPQFPVESISEVLQRKNQSVSETSEPSPAIPVMETEEVMPTFITRRLFTSDDSMEGKEEEATMTVDERLALSEDDILTHTQGNESQPNIQDATEEFRAILQAVKRARPVVDPQTPICPSSFTDTECAKPGCKFQHLSNVISATNISDSP